MDKKKTKKVIVPRNVRARNPIKAYKTKEGDVILIDTSKEVCEKKGFLSGQQVEHLDGTRGVALGVSICPSNPLWNRKLWFYFEGNSGISYFGFKGKIASEGILLKVK